jgi:hypothetical protein
MGDQPELYAKRFIKSNCYKNKCKDTSMRNQDSLLKDAASHVDRKVFTGYFSSVIRY